MDHGRFLNQCQGIPLAAYSYSAPVVGEPFWLALRIFPPLFQIDQFYLQAERSCSYLNLKFGDFAPQPERRKIDILK